MIEFEKMGTMEYLTSYKIDKDLKVIAEYTALIKNIKDKYFNVVIHAERIVDDDKCYYDTSVQLTDSENNHLKFYFEYPYIMRIDHYMTYIDQMYHCKIKDKNFILDYNMYTYENALSKTENEYNVKISEILGSDNVKNDLYITVDKNNVAVRTGNEIYIKPIKEDGSVDVGNILEMFILSENGMMHFLKDHIIYDSFEEDKEIKHIEYSDLFIPENDILSCIPEYYMIMKEMKTDSGNHIKIDYDEFGIMRESTEEEKDPIICESYYDTIYDKHILNITNSLHPMYIDLNNMSSYYRDGLYALDKFVYIDEYNSKFANYTRQVRNISDKDKHDIIEAIELAHDEDAPILYDTCLESIMDDFLKEEK